MSLRKITLAPLLALTLSGCNDAIDTVKSSRMEINDQYTVDQAFSNRSLCESVDWDVITDDRNRELVQYKGFYPISTDGLKRAENFKSCRATLRRIRGLWNRSM